MKKISQLQLDLFEGLEEQQEIEAEQFTFEEEGKPYEEESPEA